MSQFDAKNRVLLNTTYEIFVILMVLLSIANIVLLILLNSPEARRVVLIIDVGITLFLMADAVYRLASAPQKRRYLIDFDGWMVLVGSLPVPGLSVFRLVQTIRLTRQFRRSDYAIMGRSVAERRAQSALAAAAFLAILILEIGGITILRAESTSPGANIKTASDALWWGYVTVATVGYGDKYPVTNAGRAVGVLMMTIGVGLFGVLTGFLADWFRRPRKPAAAGGQAMARKNDVFATAEELRRLLDAQEQAYSSSMAEIRARLEALERSATQSPRIEPSRET
jgi:voltage-gated potassium channel Kch